MNCIRCRTRIAEDSRFCPACGTKQELPCQACGASNFVGHRFCSGCGVEPWAAVGAGTDAAAPPRAAPAERRSLTVVFCDLVGSVALSAQLDAEDMRDLLRAYHGLCAEAVARLDGHVAQYLGDGVLVYFGYPTAHEDDARRAVHAALDILAGLQPLCEWWQREKQVEVRLRIGVHSGTAVVGEVGSGTEHSALATGETPNLAARMQTLAEPGTIAISAATEALVRGYFRLQPLGQQMIRGRDDRMAAYRVLGATDAQSRLAAAGEDGLLPFVGRGSAVDLLLSRWALVQQGRGHALLLRGEAGIGKSRLLQTLRLQAFQAEGQNQPAQYAEAQCSPYQQGSAFGPVIALLEKGFGLRRQHSAAQRTQALVAGLQALGLDAQPEATPLLAALLDVTPPPGLAPLQLTPQRQRRSTIDTLVQVVLAQARKGPLLLAVEDLHWADPSTLELLAELAAELSAPGASAQLMLALTCRPEFNAAFGDSAEVHEIELDALPDEAARRVVANVVANVSQGRTLPNALPEALLKNVLDRAAGNPLYLEEITKVMLDAAASGTAADAIPATVQESLLARVDRLGPAKATAQLAAALGRQFSAELLQAVSDLPAPELDRALQRLVQEEFVLARRSGGEDAGQAAHPVTHYTFKHALLQDAAYGSLLRSSRREMHALIARTLTERFEPLCAAQPELVAHHCTEGGQVVDAIRHWRLAADKALTRSAQAEAGSHLQRALDLVRTLPLGPERVQGELGLLITLGPLLMATRGYADAGVELTYRQAREICAQIGDTPQIVPVLFGLWAYYVVRADLKIARDLTEQLWRLVEHGGDDGMKLEVQLALGTTMYFQGEFAHARQKLETAAGLYDPALHRVHAQIFGQEPGAATHIYLAQTLALMGEAALSAQHAATALRLAEEAAHDQTTAYVLTYSALLQLWAGDTAAASATAQRGGALAREQGFPIWQVGCDSFGGSADIARGLHSADTLARMQAAADTAAGGLAELYAPYLFGLAADAQHLMGQLDDARTQIDTAVLREAGSEQRVTLAELHRLRAIVMLTQGEPLPAVRDELQRAIDLAVAQGAGLWAQRARASLAQLAPTTAAPAAATTTTHGS